ncbi:MAG TPA: SRPBCC family protein [Acidimicrobiia bacterium]|nr:SRPBCC family protein [Acidimicrobiia bacterium]
MKLEHDFQVGVPIADAWATLLDIERIAPCMPGAQLQEVDGDEYRGIVKVKVGPITAQYKGVARLTEANEHDGRLVITAEGRDTRGQGNASATITAQLAPDGDGTRVHVDTDLNVTGKVAQFGRGVMADVSSKLLGQFVDCLSTNILGPATAPSTPDANPAPSPARPAAADPRPTPDPAPPSPPAASSGPRRVESPEAEAVDLMRAAGGAVAKRLVPLVAAGVVVVGVVVWLLVR